MDDERLYDSHGNSASISYFGSREAAQQALNSLDDCVETVDCRNCSGCWYCEMCQDCSVCLSSVGLKNCSRCIGCYSCVDSKYLAGCKYCERCNSSVDCCDSADCTYCVDCIACSTCHNTVGVKELADSVGNMPSIPKLARAAITALVVAPLPRPDYASEDTLDDAPAKAIVELAGDAGRALQTKFGTDLAALLIARESDCELSPIQVYTFRNDADVSTRS